MENTIITPKRRKTEHTYCRWHSGEPPGNGKLGWGSRCE